MTLFESYKKWCHSAPLEQGYNEDVITLYTLSKTQAMFKYDGLPDTISETALELLLQSRGYGIGIIHEGKPYIIEGNFGGKRNQNYFPTTAVVGNAYLDISQEYVIGKDCVVVKSDSMCIGLLPLIRKYAYLQARSEMTMKIKDTMSRTPYIITATTDRAKESAELFLKRVEDGSPAIIKDNKVLNADDISVFPNNDTSRSVSEAIEYNQYIKGSFLNELGLNANFNMKREYVSNGETGLNVQGLRPFVDDMLECRLRGISEFNTMFGTDITVGYNSVWREESAQNVSDKTETT